MMVNGEENEMGSNRCPFLLSVSHFLDFDAKLCTGLEIMTLITQEL